MRGVIRTTYLFVFGAAAYGFLEMVCRGKTHWSMLLAGGAALLFLYALHRTMQPIGRLARCLIGCCMITGMELLLGWIVNRKMGLGVWDYSGMPLNLLGQICPKYSTLWFLLCLPADWLCGRLHDIWNGAQDCAK